MKPNLEFCKVCKHNHVFVRMLPMMSSPAEWFQEVTVGGDDKGCRKAIDSKMAIVNYKNKNFEVPKECPYIECHVIGGEPYKATSTGKVIRNSEQTKVMQLPSEKEEI